MLGIFDFSQTSDRLTVLSWLEFNPYWNPVEFKSLILVNIDLVLYVQIAQIVEDVQIVFRILYT